VKIRKRDLSTIDEIAAEVRGLPADKQAAVLEFVRILKGRQSSASNQLIHAQESSLAHAWDDEVWDRAETT